MPHSKSKPIASLTLFGTSRLVRCWDVVLRNGRGTIRFTEHDRPLTVDGNTYDPTDGIAATALIHSGQLTIPNQNVRGILSDANISEDFVREGSLNGATVTEFLVDHRFPFAGTSRRSVFRVGRITWNDAAKGFEADLVGMSERLTNRVGRVMSTRCDAVLGDARCGVNLATYQKSGTIATVTNRARFTATLSGGDLAIGWFDNGLVTMTSGGNSGLSFAVKRYEPAWTLHLPAPYAFAVADTFTVTPGCNKLHGTDMEGLPDPDGDCINKFANGVRFRGFPHAPTNERLYRTPAAEKAEAESE